MYFIVLEVIWKCVVDVDRALNVMRNLEVNRAILIQGLTILTSPVLHHYLGYLRVQHRERNSAS